MVAGLRSNYPQWLAGVTQHPVVTSAGRPAGKGCNMSDEKDRQRLMEELFNLNPSEVVEVPLPEEVKLREWLGKNRIDELLVPHWPHEVAAAKRLGIPVPVMELLAALFDELFEGTSNTFGAFNRRPHVTMETLYPYLEARHKISRDDANALTPTELAELLSRDIDSGRYSEPAKPPGRRCRLSVERTKNGDFVCLDATRYEVSATAADFIERLIESGSDWFSASAADLRPHRIVPSLSEPIAQLIECKPGGGSKLRAEAWLS